MNAPQSGHGETGEGPYAHVLKNVGAERRVYFLPAAQVSCSFVEQVTVSRRQQVPHEYDGCADGHKDEELTRPALVHVLRALRTKIHMRVDRTNDAGGRCSKDL